MIAVGYPEVSSSFAGRVSPTIAKRRLETDPPEAVTVPVIVVGIVAPPDPDPDPEECADEVPEPDDADHEAPELDDLDHDEPEPDDADQDEPEADDAAPASEHVVPPPQPVGGAWHLLVLRSQYQPP